MKISLNVYVSVLLIWLLYGCNAGKTDWDGKRIEQPDLNADPVLIESAAQLAWLASPEGDLQKNYLLTTDIDLNPGVKFERNGTFMPEDKELNVWMPIGYATGRPWKGRFDGGGHRIAGLYNGNFPEGGLFYCIGAQDSYGEVKNLTIESGVITKKRDLHIGTFGVYNFGLIENCVNKARVNGSYFVGGICGENRGEIRNCRNEGWIWGRESGAGGMCGRNFNLIRNCVNDAMIFCSNNAGGICGVNEAVITDCDNDGRIEGYATVGGICGTSTYLLENCINRDTVFGEKAAVGGIFGFGGGKMLHCSNEGVVAGKGIQVGGILGTSGNNNAYFIGCSNRGQIYGDKMVGGICGDGGTIYIACYNTGDIQANRSVGGLSGDCVNGVFYACYSVGDVVGGEYVYGIVGQTGGLVRATYVLATGVYGSDQDIARLQNGPAVLLEDVLECNARIDEMNAAIEEWNLGETEAIQDRFRYASSSPQKCVYRYKKDEESGNSGLPVVYKPDLGQ
ncbi:hypothetical protein [Culturomica massiliensis]|uniref:hypothetical protein n=1 Tax=Culturomica massiliensis TaxID=1841857 RepID=UPI00033D87A7|nr:hypothetical protein [Culturomica massiliensis]CCZ07122.1 putative uncharacterized protein [Odoribacter sp. CAG:788]